MDALILGLGIFAHDTAIAFMRGGKVLFAAEQERFDRRKHSRAFPFEAIRAGLRFIGAQPGDIRDVAVNFSPPLMVRNYGLLFWRHLPRSLRLLFDVRRWANAMRTGSFREQFAAGLDLPAHAVRWHTVPHHLCHLASAFYRSPFEEAALLSSDNLGEFISVVTGVGKTSSLKVLRELPYPHSVGAVYSAVTDHLGFRIYSGEGKVMGLAGYGRVADPPAFRDLYALDADGGFRILDRWFTYHLALWQRTDWTSTRFRRRFGPPRAPEAPLAQAHYDLAAETQDMADRILLHLCRHLARETGQANLCYAGGVALNGYGNRRILTETPFSGLFVQPAANDGGTALGAALYHSHVTLGQPREPRDEHTYLGPAYSSEECRQALTGAEVPFSRPADLAMTVARHLHHNRIVGWFQGRMELGPRALGNRSLLANPCMPWMKDHLNARVKHREGFRPFAPVVPVEAAHRFFDLPCAESPYMLIIAPVKPEWRDRLPAVTHVDGTARVQTLRREDNPRLYDLLLAFEKMSGVPVLLNTSFNGPEEPIVCTPADAIRTFQRHPIDTLVLEDYLVSRQGQDLELPQSRGDTEVF